MANPVTVPVTLHARQATNESGSHVWSHLDITYTQLGDVTSLKRLTIKKLFVRTFLFCMHRHTQTVHE